MLKLNVGLSRKIGEANYGSRGASVHLELEVESGLATDPGALRDRVRQLFQMARVSVDEELQIAGPIGNGSGDHGNGNGSGNGNGHGDDRGRGTRRSSGRGATQSQVRAIHAIANRLQLDLAGELHGRFGVERPEDLSINEASELIDSIKPQTSGSGARR